MYLSPDQLIFPRIRNTAEEFALQSPSIMALKDLKRNREEGQVMVHNPQEGNLQ